MLKFKKKIRNQKVNVLHYSTAAKQDGGTNKNGNSNYFTYLCLLRLLTMNAVYAVTITSPYTATKRARFRY